jgi:hypothetical protein
MATIIMKKNRYLFRVLMLVLILTSFSLSNLYAQTGPGGVGNQDGSDGQPKNVIWFAADSLSLSDTDPVATWTDISGNGNNGVQGVSGSQPTFITNQLNGYPIIYFDGTTNDFMPFDGTTVVGTNITAIYVAARRNSNYNLVMGGTESSANRNMHLGWQTATNGIFNHWSNDLYPTLSGDGSGYIGDADPSDDYGIFINRLKPEANPARKVFQNGTMIGSINNINQLISYTGSALGSRNGSYYNVNIAEVILYSTALNDAQLQIVNQYLNVKYGINIFNDLYDPDVNYIHNVVGIGEENNEQHSNAVSAGMHLTALGGLNNNDYIFTSHNNLTNNSANFRTDPEVTNAGIDSAYNRVWYIDTVGTPEAQLAFDFDEALDGGLNPTNIANYALLYRTGTSGDFTIVKNADGLKNGDQVYFNLTSADLKVGYYTLGTEDASLSPLEGVPGRTWYTLISGNWGDWEIWTLDPSGALPNNPDQLTPDKSPTNTADKVVIKTGRTVEVDTINNLAHASITIEGRLDLTTTTGHSFGEILGTGRVLLAADNFPSGDATHFYTEGQGEGTVEFYGGSYDLSIAREFYDVEVILDDPANTITLLNDYDINGNLTITTGEVQINDATDDQIINLTVDGDVLVEANGKISVGTGNPYAIAGYTIGGGVLPAEYHSMFHQFNMSGNFTNMGTVRLHNLDAPMYDSLAINGAVTVRFQGASNAEVNLYKTTDFYNLIIDKGTDKTYKVNIYSDNIAYFRLFGANSVGRSEAGSYTAEDPQIRKALFIHHGTLQLRGNVYIPTLSEGNDVGGNGDYAVGKNARLWMDGSNVTVYSTASEVDQITGFTSGDANQAQGFRANSSNQAMSIYGEFKITDGYFGTRNSAGFIFWAAGNPQVKIEGGTCYVAQMRSAGGGSGIASYSQTGGTVIAFGNSPGYGEYTGAYPLFGLESTDAVFQMSGGEIIIQDDDGDADPEFYVISSVGNYQVTGGTVTFDLPNGRTAQIQATTNLWDLDLTNSSSTGNITVEQLVELTVMGDLNLNNYTTLNSAGFGLNIGDGWEFADGASYTHGGNTVSFVGRSNSYVYVRNTSNVHELVLNNVTLYKDQRYDNSLFRNVDVRSGGGRLISDSPLLIEGNLTITRGEFDVNRWEIDLDSNLVIVDGQIVATDTPQGRIVLNGTDQQTIKGSDTDEQDFGHLELDNANGAILLSNINVTDFTLTQGIMNLDIYNLDVSDALNTSGTYSSTLMYKTAGNASDGGITRYVDLSVGTTDTETLYPFGTGTSYTPAKAIQSATIADAGKISINPVAKYHPATSDQTKTIPYYWTTDTSGFSSVVYTQLKYTFTYPGSMPGSVNKGSNLWDVDYDWYTHNNVKNGSDIEFPYAAYLTEDFTLGNNSVFKTPAIYYSRVSSGNWSSGNSWSTDSCGGPVAGTIPSSYDIVKIGYSRPLGVYTRHRITLNMGTAASPIEIAGLILEQNPEAGAVETNMSRLIIPPTRGLKVNGKISGDGEFQFQMDGTDIPTFEGDFGDFVNTEGASVIMRSNNGNVIAPTNLTRFPRLSIPGSAVSYDDTRSVTFTTDIYCHNLNVRYGGTLLLNSGTNGDIEVRDSLRIGGIGSDNEGRVIYQNNNTARAITVRGDLIFDTDDAATNDDNQLYVETGGTDNLEHYLKVYGDIIMRNPGSYMDLFTANDGAQSNVIMEILGEDNAEFIDDNNTIPELYRIVMNKGGAGNPRFDFNDAFTLWGPTDGDPKAIELISGTLDLSDTGIDVILSSGGEDFKIPQEANLQASRATLRLTGDNTGIWLDGTIRVGYASKWYLNEGVNNYIEYTSSGISEIAIYQGEFYVGSQIRRSAITEEGILNFRQEHLNSTVIIGTDADQGGETDRGVFELVNTGSQFTQVAGAKISIANAIPSATAPSFYLNLDATELSLADGSIIEFGGDSTEASQSLSVYSSQALKNINIDNSSANNPILILETIDLELDTLIIDSGSTLDANGLDLTLLGNFVNSGTFTSNQNSTYFTGSVNQNITGSTIFYNLYKTTSNLLTLNNDVNVDNELHLDNGTFNDGDNTLSVQGNAWMDITHTWGGSSNGILLNGSSEQVLLGNGIFGKLSVNNSAGISIPQNNIFTIDGVLQLENGVLDVGKNLLIIDEDAIVIEKNIFSENNMIQTNISFTDAGIKKYFTAIVPADNYNFIYPLGSEGKYSPIELSIDSVGAGGSIRVKAANEIHPTIVNDAEPCNEIVDTLNVLKYHWLMEADNISGFNANASMKYYTEDYQENSAFYNVADYIAARLLWGSTFWNKYDQASFDEGNGLLRFSFSNNDDDGISGDYTAGVEDQGGTCEGAIPDEVPAYISISDGEWTDGTIWDTYPISGGFVPLNGPRGAVAIVEHEVIIPSNYILNYKTTINSTGILKVGTTFGHRLGIVEGTGILQLERGNLPAGIYDDFFSRTGGTIEFTGNTDYDVLSEVVTVRNLKFSGTGERRLPNLDFEVYGLFTIAGSDANLWVINEHDRNMTLDSNVVFSQGSFDAGVGGVGESTVTMNGTSAQTIDGNFTGTNAFNNFTIDNSAGVSLLGGGIEIDKVLDFANGIITTSATSMLTVDNSAQTTAVINSSASKYVDGPMRKRISINDSFIFPVGDNTRYGQLVLTNATASSEDYWEVEYYDANPHPTYDTSSYLTPLNMVSGNEYWRINGPEATSTATVTVRWDAQSGLPAMASDRTTDMHIAEWIGGGTNEWQSVGDIVSDGGVNSGTITSTGAITLQEHYFTIASDEATPLPTATFTSTDVEICSGQSTNLVIALTGDPNWVVTIEEGGDSYTFPAQATSPLTFSVDSAGTYTITAVSDNNGAGVVFGNDVVVTVNLTPAIFNVTGGGQYCEGGAGVSVGLDGSEGGVNYELFAGATSVGVFGGTGVVIDFGNQTNTGTVNYTVVATDASGSCSENMTGSVDVLENILPAANDQTPANLCSEASGETVQITGLNLTSQETLINGGVNITYAWYSDAGLTTSVGTPNSVDINDVFGGGISITKVYYCQVTNTITTCTDVATVTYTINRLPQTGPQYHISNDF